MFKLFFLGHCFEAYTGNPPRGLQLSLGTKQVENVMDTIVMANLGYLQLKSSPGRWLLKLRQGRSDELYDIVSIDGKIFRHNKFQYSREQKHVLLFRKSGLWECY